MINVYQNLWKQVLLTAFEDKDNDYINLNNEDFLTVCEFAGVNPLKVRENFVLKHLTIAKK